MLKAIAILLPSSTPDVLHVALERRDLVFIDEHQEIAGMGEIDLRGKERRRGHAHAALFRKPGQRRGEQGAADAIAHGVDLHFAGGLFDDVHRRQRAFLHVVFEGLGAELLVRIDPGDHEHGDALVDAPFDEGFLRLEIEDVELVDPRRHDQQRRAQHVFGRRRILDQLHQLVLEDHLARRRRHVDADLEIGRIGLADAQRCRVRPRCPPPASSCRERDCRRWTPAFRAALPDWSRTKFDGASALVICWT